MNYIEDTTFKYKDALIKNLRAYNKKYTGEKDSSNEYFYAIKDEKLVGAIYTNYSWDWVGIGTIFYDNIDVLKSLVSAISNYFKNKAVGLKLYTEIESRVNDFKSIGFKLSGITENTPKTTRYFYLKYTDFNIRSDSHINIISTTKKIEAHDLIVCNQIERFNIANNIRSIEEKDIMFVALDKNQFVGGVYGSVTEDSMYINWLVVTETCRGNGVGKNLMLKIEERAKRLNVYSINLGTVEFQAEKFYEKLGYKIVFIKENDPRGYNSYSMIKKL